MANKVLDRDAIATTIKDTKLPPILRWAGGKRKHTWLFDAINQVFNPHKNRLVEPFVGGAAITLEVNPKWALLNDANPYLINLYSQIKRGFGHFLPTMLQVCGYSLVFWIAFNFSVGTAIAFQIDFVQSFSFVCLIKVIKGAIAS